MCRTVLYWILVFGIVFTGGIDVAECEVVGDFDSDGDVDIYDFEVFASHWLSSEAQADFDGSGIVNLLDFGRIAGNWYGSTGSIQPYDAHIRYTGRVLFDDPNGPVLYWPGISIAANFEGTSVKVKMNDFGDNYFNVFIDDADPIVLDCVPGEMVYDIASGLTDGIHEIEIFRRTEADNGGTMFLGFELDTGSYLVSPPARAERKIEFYGDSITVGLAIESSSDNHDPVFTNNYLAYGALTARNLNAEYHCIARSGIGIMVSWFPEIMPGYYYRHDPTDSESYWDFTQWVPDVVVINLGQNDYWLRENETDEEIIDAYVDFINSIRTEYADAHIFMALGNMNATEPGSQWPGYIESAVSIMNTTYNDEKVYSIIFPYKQTSGHPIVSEHEDMANQLTTFIENTTGW